MRDGGAAGKRGGAHRGRAVRVHPGPQAERRRLAARRLNLRVGHRLRSALPDALRCEQLDQIGAGGLDGAHERANLIRCAGVLVDRTDRGQQARAGKDAARDRATNLDVQRRSDALDRREAGHQRDVGVLRLVQDRLRRGFTLARRAAVLSEMRVEVDVRVDQAGEQRQAAQIVGGGRGTAAREAGDLALLHDEGCVGHDPAATVERRLRSDRHRLILCGRDRRRHDDCEGNDDSLNVHS